MKTIRNVGDLRDALKGVRKDTKVVFASRRNLRFLELEIIPLISSDGSTVLENIVILSKAQEVKRVLHNTTV